MPRTAKSEAIRLTEIAQTSDDEYTGSGNPPNQFKANEDQAWPVWRKNLLAGAAAAALVLVLNIIFLVVGAARSSTFAEVPRSASSSLVLWHGSCESTGSVSTWGHLAINILSTVLLTASAACMQCLGAPSRGDVDKAHSKGLSLRIGLLSLTNLKYASWKRRLIWLVMALSSIPLHLLYNSALFTTSTTGQTLALLMPNMPVNGMLDMSYLNTTDEKSSAYRQLASSLQNGSVQSLPYAQCREAFAMQDTKAYGNVLLISSMETSNMSHGYRPLAASTAMNWAQRCPLDQMYNSSSARNFFTACTNEALTDADRLLDEDDNVIRPYQEINQDGHYEWFYYSIASNLTNPVAPGFFTVDHCVAEKIETKCLVELNVGSMIIVIIANFIKLTLLVYVVLTPSMDPMITIGDAISSFLDVPDPVTEDLGIVSSGNIAAMYNARSWEKSDGIFHDHEDIYTAGKMFVQRNSIWWHSIALRRWYLTLGPWTLAMIITIIACIVTLRDESFQWQDWGRISSGKVIEATRKNDFAVNVIIANSPQLILSLYYILFNSLVTTMLVSNEFTSFATKRKPLRVSNPKGGQRQTYWLQVPFRYGIPLTALSVFLHWLMSQALFAVHIDYLDLAGNLIPNKGTDGVVGCVSALVMLLVCAVLIAVAVVVLARFKKFDLGSVLIAHDSLALSAAAHKQAGEPDNASEKPLMYGVLEERGPSGYKRVGFSSFAVGKLVDGQIYDCTCSLEKLDGLWYNRSDHTTMTRRNIETHKKLVRRQSFDDDDDYI